MKQLTKHDVNKLTVAAIKEFLPAELVADGEVIAILISPHDVNKLEGKSKASHDVHKLAELPFSKSKQASHSW